MRPLARSVKLNTVAMAVRAVVGLVILGASVAFFTALVATRQEAPRLERPTNALVVRAMDARRVPVTRSWSAYGAARAMTTADIAAQVEGVVIDRPDTIEAGAPIKAGDLIAQIDPEDYENALARVRETRAALTAELESLDVEDRSLEQTLAFALEAVDITERELNRLREAAQRAAATQTEVERLARDLTRVRREAEDLRQRLNLVPTRRAALLARIAAEDVNEAVALLNLQRTRIVAPFDGSLQRVDVNVGERVSPGDIVARIVDLRRMEAPLQAPVSAASFLSVGDDVALAADSPSGLHWTARLARIAPEIDPATRTVVVFVELTQNPGIDAALLLPGQFLVGTVSAGRAEPRIIVPRAAVTADRVWIIDDQGRAQPRSVTVAHHIDQPYPDLLPAQTQWAVIEAGVEPGETVIISNIEDLAAGMPVEAGPGAGR